MKGPDNTTQLTLHGKPLETEPERVKPLKRAKCKKRQQKFTLKKIREKW